MAGQSVWWRLALLWLVHLAMGLVLWLLAQADAGWFTWHRWLSTFRRLLSWGERRRRMERTMLADAVSQLPKKPHHLAVVLVDEQPSFVDAAKLTSWALLVGVPVLTFYDHHGAFKKGQEELRQALQRTYEQYFPNQRKHRFVFHNSLKKNGYVGNGKKQNEEDEVHVVLTSYEDGRPDLVRVAREECAAVAQSSKSPKQVAEDNISELLSATKGLPDPDLILRFGSILSMVGFLPWQIRLSEFFTIKSLWGITVDRFIDALYFFGKVEQRFGK